MGWSVYIIDQNNNLAFEIGESWCTGFPLETLLSKDLVMEELERRHSSKANAKLADKIEAFMKSADFNVRIHEGQEVPDGIRYVGNFLDL